MGIVPPFVPQNKFMMKQRARFSTLSNEFQWKLITTKNEGKSLELGGKGEGALFAGTNYYIRQICFSACEKVDEDGRESERAKNAYTHYRISPRNVRIRGARPTRRIPTKKRKTIIKTKHV